MNCESTCQEILIETFEFCLQSAFKLILICFFVSVYLNLAVSEHFSNMLEVYVRGVLKVCPGTEGFEKAYR